WRAGVGFNLCLFVLERGGLTPLLPGGCCFKSLRELRAFASWRERESRKGAKPQRTAKRRQGHPTRDARAGTPPPAHSKLLPRFRRNFQRQPLTVAHYFDFVLLSGFHLA